MRPVSGSSSIRVESAAGSRTSTCQRVRAGLPVAWSTRCIGRFGQSAARGQVDLASVIGQQALHYRDVVLAHLPAFEGGSQVALRGQAAGEDQQAGGGLVQPVDHQGFGKHRLHAGGGTVGLVSPTARDGEQAEGLSMMTKWLSRCRWRMDQRGQSYKHPTNAGGA